HNITLELTDEYGNHWFSMGLLNLTRIELHQNSSDFINSKDEIKLDLRLITLLGLVLLILIVYKIELETLFISKSIIKINKKTRIGINKLQNRLKKD
ncbi:MAG: hypothetical protein OEY49_18055, partial [Candidatus Heimdallarchaeota archaeon]|nr:hypothetical protein [Candidatus Heimdallarchaeota archaeon]